jgi:hypothetical protein
MLVALQPTSHFNHFRFERSSVHSLAGLGQADAMDAEDDEDWPVGVLAGPLRMLAFSSSRPEPQPPRPPLRPAPGRPGRGPRRNRRPVAARGRASMAGQARLGRPHRDPRTGRPRCRAMAGPRRPGGGGAGRMARAPHPGGPRRRGQRRRTARAARGRAWGSSACALAGDAGPAWRIRPQHRPCKPAARGVAAEPGKRGSSRVGRHRAALRYRGARLHPSRALGGGHRPRIGGPDPGRGRGPHGEVEPGAAAAHAAAATVAGRRGAVAAGGAAAAGPAVGASGHAGRRRE